MRLALELGRVNVDKMLDAIDEDQFREWIAFDRLDPLGSRRESLQVALMAAVLGNIQIAKGKRLKPEMFMPFTTRVTGGQQTDEQQIAICRQIAASQNSRR